MFHETKDSNYYTKLCRDYDILTRTGTDLTGKYNACKLIKVIEMAKLKLKAWQRQAFQLSPGTMMNQLYHITYCTSSNKTQTIGLFNTCHKNKQQRERKKY